MKKIIIALFAVASVYTSFGQGYFVFSGNKNIVKDDFTTSGTSVSSAGTVTVGFLWTASANAPAIGATGNPAGNTAGLAASTWNTILNDPNYQLAYNTNGTLVTATTSASAAGSFSYVVPGGGSTFAVLNTSSAASYKVYVIGWSSAYADPATAQSHGSAVGWSGVFTYASGADQNATPPTFGTAGLTAFGVSPVVPEPTTVAFVGIGAAAMFLARRRKQA